MPAVLLPSSRRYLDFRSSPCSLMLSNLLPTSDVLYSLCDIRTRSRISERLSCSCVYTGRLCKQAPKYGRDVER